MATPVTDPTTQPPAITSAALTWWRYDVVNQQSMCALLSMAARGLDAALTDDAWSNPDGSCTVATSRLTARCEKEGLEVKALWQELSASGRWVLTDDKRRIVAPWLVERRLEAAQVIVKRRAAGKRSGAVRSTKAKAKASTSRRTRPAADIDTADSEATGTPEHVFNTCSGTDAGFPDIASSNSMDRNDLNMCSTRVLPEQITEESRTTDLSSRDHVVQLSAGDAAPAATSPAASHAGGAAALVAPARVVPDLKAMLAEQNILAVEPPVAWMQADVPDVVDALRAAGTGVDIERALFRAFAMHQKRGLEAHQPLLEELRRGLAGAEGRAGFIGAGPAAARSLALALHGTAVMEFPPAPLVLRAVAGAIDRELREHGDQGDAKRMAVRIALEFARPGGRKASGYALAGELPPVERLNGFVTKQAVLV